MRATTFAPTIAETGLDAPALTVLVKFDDGKKRGARELRKSGADVHALVPGQPGAAKIEAEKFAEANKTLDELSKMIAAAILAALLVAGCTTAPQAVLAATAHASVAASQRRNAQP